MSPSSAPDLSQLRVLVIDDHELVRDTLIGTLENAGCEVVGAESGPDGLRAFETFRADVVITDILMPGQEGFETISTFKTLSPDVRIIAISGGGSIRRDDVLDQARSLGADEVLAKPFTRDQILGLLNAFCAAKS